MKKIIKNLIPQFVSVWTAHRSWRKEDIQEMPYPINLEIQTINNYEYALFSQHKEDGIIRYLFSEIGFDSKLFLEFGFDVTENNSLRLLLKEGFGGLFIDGSEQICKLFNKSVKSFGLQNVKAISRFLNLKNIEQTIKKGGLSGEIDFMSIDVDGNDYWFWEKVKCVSPRLVAIEYNASLGPSLSLTVPYDPNFIRHEKHKTGFYCGASIAALERLGQKKGYRLVGCDSNGVNAFFIRKDIHTPNVRTLDARAAYKPHKSRLNRGFSLERQYEIIKDLPYIEII